VDRLVGGSFLSREGWEAPGRFTLVKLASLNILLDSLLAPFLVWTIQAVERNSDWRASGDKTVLKTSGHRAMRVGEPHAAAPAINHPLEKLPIWRLEMTVSIHVNLLT
jgi:hypothetical protein